MWITVPLHCFLEEFQCSGFVSWSQKTEQDAKVYPERQSDNQYGTKETKVHRQFQGAGGA
jgi:hypothetical protein